MSDTASTVGKKAPSLDRCPGSGLTMVPRTYLIRDITDEDRARYQWRIERCEARGDDSEAEGERQALADWEREQGQERERMVSSVCADPFLSPTSKGTSRPHRRRDDGNVSWDRVRQLRKDITGLQAELDRVLDKLEP